MQAGPGLQEALSLQQASGTLQLDAAVELLVLLAAQRYLWCQALPEAGCAWQSAELKMLRSRLPKPARLQAMLLISGSQPLRHAVLARFSARYNLTLAHTEPEFNAYNKMVADGLRCGLQAWGVAKA